MGKPVEIRLAKPGEAGTLTALCLRSKRSNGYDDAFMAACVNELTVSEAQLKIGNVWVAESDGICGCAVLNVDTDGFGGEVAKFFVDPDFHRCGVGKLLWCALLEEARRLGLNRLFLDADPSAVPFYEAMGFVVIGDSPSGSIPGRRLPHMAMDID